jgi:hypothetical protein
MLTNTLCHPSPDDREESRDRSLGATRTEARAEDPPERPPEPSNLEVGLQHLIWALSDGE